MASVAPPLIEPHQQNNTCREEQRHQHQNQHHHHHQDIYDCSNYLKLGARSLLKRSLDTSYHSNQQHQEEQRETNHQTWSITHTSTVHCRPFVTTSALALSRSSSLNPVYDNLSKKRRAGGQLQRSQSQLESKSSSKQQSLLRSISKSLKMVDRSCKDDEGKDAIKTPGKGSRSSKILSSGPRRASISLSSITSPNRKGLFNTVANTFSPNRRPVTPPAVIKAMGGLHSSDKLKHSETTTTREHSSRSPISSAKEKERELLNKRSEDNGIYQWTDVQLAHRYTFEKEIGYGNWGSCWLAETRITADEIPKSTKIAIKLVHRQGTPPSNARVKALWNEYKVLRSCGKPIHDNLVQFKLFVITPSYALVVMDYYQKTMNVALPVSTYAGSDGYFYQLLSSIQWLHSKNVTHCDIKVANLLVDTRVDKDRGKPILVDFGFATLHDEKTNFMSKQSWGTPEYLSPERSRGELHDERLSDIWALGVTFFEIATGRTPFEHDDEQFLSKEQLEIYYERTLNPKWIGTWSIPPSLESLCRLMLTPDANKRILSTQALQHPFFTKTGETFEREFVFGIDESVSGNKEDSRAAEQSLPKSESDSKVTDSTRSSNNTPARPAIVTSQLFQPPTSSVGLRTPVLPKTTVSSSLQSPASLLLSPLRSTERKSGAERAQKEILSKKGSIQDGNGIDKNNHSFQDQDMVDYNDSGKIVSLSAATTVVRTKIASCTTDEISLRSSAWFSPSPSGEICESNLQSQIFDKRQDRPSTRQETLRSSNGGHTPNDIHRRETNRTADPHRPRTIHGTTYPSKAEEEGEEELGTADQSVNYLRKPVRYRASDAESPRIEINNKERAYEIMADKRNRLETRLADPLSYTGSNHVDEGCGIQEQMENMASQVQDMHTELQCFPSTNSPIRSEFSGRSNRQAEELAARLDEMGILAASLARMVEDTKSKLSQLQDAKISKSSRPSIVTTGLEPKYGNELIKTPQRLGSQYSSVTRAGISSATRPDHSPRTISLQSHTTPTSMTKNKTFTTLRRKISLTLPGNKDKEKYKDSVGSIVPFPVSQRESHESSRAHHQTPIYAERAVTNRGQSPIVKEEETVGGGASPATLTRANSSRGRALSHFLNRYGSRNNRSAAAFKTSTEAEEDCTSKTSTTLYDKSSSEGVHNGPSQTPGKLTNSNNVRRPSAGVKSGFNTPFKSEIIQRKPSQHFFDDDGVVDIGAKDESRSVVHQRSIKTSNDLSIKSPTRSHHQQVQPSPATASRHLSRIYQNRTEVVKSSPLNIATQPVPAPSKQQTSYFSPTVRKTSVQGQHEGRISRMKSFTLGRPASAVIQNRSEDSSSHYHQHHHHQNSIWQRSRDTSNRSNAKGKRDTLIDIDFRIANDSRPASPTIRSNSPPLSPHVGQDPPRHYTKSRDSSCQSINPPTTPGGGLWSRFFRGNNNMGSSRH